MRASLFAVLLVVLAQVTFADTAADQDQRYEGLKRDWLSGEHDLKTLRDMATLAQQDHVPTQALLGLIQTRPHTYVHAVKDLSRDDYKAIFRKPVGKFGKSWIRVAADSDPLAALISKTDVDDFETHAIALAQAGLPTEAIKAGNLLIMNSELLGALRVQSHPDLLPYTRATFHWNADWMERGLRLQKNTKDADKARELRFSVQPPDFKEQLLFISSGQQIRLLDLPVKTETLRLRGAALLHHPDIKPLSELIKEVCPNDTAYHLGLLFHMTGSLSFRLAVNSPLEPLITTDEWQSSPRFRGDLLRLWDIGSPRFQMLETLSPCIADAITAEM